MSNLSFGTPRFRLLIDEVSILEATPHLSQITIRLSGEDWSVASDVDETLGVVAELLGRFHVRPQVRHWGAFAGLGTFEEVLDRVLLFGYGSPTSPNSLRKRHVSSAMCGYSLSTCFDYGLGVDHMISIRSHAEETLIWRTKAGDLAVHEVPVADFELAVGAFLEWAEERLEHLGVNNV